MEFTNINRYGIIFLIDKNNAVNDVKPVDSIQIVYYIDSVTGGDSALFKRGLQQT